MSKQKYYVVWNGVCPGIYTSWTDCKLQINGYAGAVYKSFDSKEEAEQAYQSAPELYFQKKVAPAPEKSSTAVERHDSVMMLPPEVIAEALAVDAACSGNPGKMEYRGVYLRTGEVVFHYGPVHGTNNIGEFLAIVHALALLKQKNSSMPIYSDSKIAMLWVSKKQCKTKLELNAKTAPLHDLIQRAENWLKNNTYETRILKWKTEIWGEIPADFGRK